MTAESPALGPLGLGPLGLGPLGLGPVGQVRIYQGAQHRFIWPVHLAGWLELGWTTEPGATPAATTAPRKKRASSSPTGASSATADEPLPVLVTDLLVEPSVPTDA